MDGVVPDVDIHLVIRVKLENWYYTCVARPLLCFSIFSSSLMNIIDFEFSIGIGFIKAL